jgi:phosphoglycerate-specific signal transduction histidine kinase
LDDVEDKINDAARATDRLYGADRIKKMKETNALLQNEIELTKKKREEAEAYLQDDKSDLVKTAKEAGVEFTFDEAGNISNYEEVMTALWEYQDKAIVSANKGGVTDKEQENLDKIQETIDKIKEKA